MQLLTKLRSWLHEALHPADASTELARKIRNQQFRAALQPIPFTSSVCIVVACVCGWLYQPHFPVWATLLWLALIVALELFSFRVYSQSINPAYYVSNKDLNLFAVITALYTLLLLAPAVEYFTLFSADIRLLISCLVAGLMGAGTFVLAPISAAGIIWVLCLCLTANLALAQIHTMHYYILIGLLNVYALVLCLVVVLNARRINDMIRAEAHAEQQGQLVGLLLKDFEGSARDWLWETDAAGKLTHVSARMTEALAKSDANALTGLPLTQLLRDSFASLTDDEQHAHAVLQSRLDTGLSFHHLIAPVMAGHELRWWSLTAKPMTDSQGQFTGWRGVGSDITDTQRHDMEMMRLANFDSLTGLANRRQLQAFLNTALPASGAAQPLMLMVLDLDNFKLVNDTLGHIMGDEMLREVAKRLATLSQQGSLVARLGGDEYALVMLGEFSQDLALGLGQRLLNLLHDPCHINEIRIELRASVGIACAPEHGTNAQDLLKAADAALYAAKDAGRDTARVYDREMDERAQHRLSILNDLGKALDNNEFELYYQPQAHARELLINGFEALLRWRHPVRGLVMPDQFISIAEETGLIVPIGVWVIEQACRDAAKWPAPLYVSVNLSAVQFASRSLMKAIETAILRSGLDTRRLEVEITESSLIQDSSGTRETLNALREKGIRVALDDFGTGYSSLAYLRSFPLDKLKIDRAFTSALESDAEGESSAIVRAIIQLASALRLQTTAEGVETPQQLNALRSKGCNEVQGHYIAKPMPASEVASFVQSWQRSS